MASNTVTSSDPKIYARDIQQQLDDLIHHTREDIDKVDEPRFQALLETSAEVLIGLRTAFADYVQGKETAFRR